MTLRGHGCSFASQLVHVPMITLSRCQANAQPVARIYRAASMRLMQQEALTQQITGVQVCCHANACVQPVACTMQSMQATYMHGMQHHAILHTCSSLGASQAGCPDEAWHATQICWHLDENAVSVDVKSANRMNRCTQHAYRV